MLFQSATTTPATTAAPAIAPPPSKRSFWFEASAALVGLAALLGQKQLGNAVSSSLQGALARRQEAHLQVLTGPALAKEQPLQDELLSAARKLGAPSQAVIALRWKEVSEKAVACFDQELARLGGETKVSAFQRRTAVVSAASRALSPQNNWMSGRELVLSTVIPAGILFYASKVKLLTPFAFVTGTIATTLAAPLLYRLAGRARIWSKQSSSQEHHAAHASPFQQGMSGVGMRGNMQHDLTHSGRFYRSLAQQNFERIVSTVDHKPLEVGLELLALGLVDLHASHPEVPIDELWSRQLALQIGERYRTTESYQHVLTLALTEGQRPEYALDPVSLQELVEATLRPQDWAVPPCGPPAAATQPPDFDAIGDAQAT